MKVSNYTTFTLCFFSLLCAPGGLLAQVSATSSAKNFGILDNAYGYASFRHYTNVKMDKDKTISRTPKVQFRPTVGTEVLKKKLDLSVTGYFNKVAQTTEVEQARSLVAASFDAYSKDAYALNPYVDLKLPGGGVGTSFSPGVDQSLSTSIATGAGALKLGVGLDAYGKFASQEETATYANNTGKEETEVTGEGTAFSLTGEPESPTIEGKKKHPDFSHDWRVNASFTPSARLFRKWRVYAEPMLINSYAPVYTLEADGAESMTYALSQTVRNLFSLKYSFDKNVSFSNDFYSFHGGIYAKQVAKDKTRFLNVAYLTYLL